MSSADRPACRGRWNVKSGREVTQKKRGSGMPSLRYKNGGMGYAGREK
jgi:hypothetical protein